MKKLIIIIIIVMLINILIDVTITQTIVKEKCPKIKAMNTKKLHQILGIWYEIKLFYNEFDEYLSCVTQNVTSFKDNKLISTYSVTMNNRFNERVKLSSMLTLRDHSKEAVFVANLYAGYNNRIGVNLKILNTKYDDCIIYWICNDNEIGSERYAWLQSRNRSISDEVFNSFREYFDKHNLGPIYMQNVNQDYCNLNNKTATTSNDNN